MDNNQFDELAVAGAEYRVGRMNAIQQFHVTRRLGPLLVVAGISVEMLQRGMKAELDDLVAMAGPVMEVLSKMSDEDTDYVLLTCLQFVQRKTGVANGRDVWSPVLAKDKRTPMYDDIDMPAMIRLVIQVLKHNLANFLTGLDVAQPSADSSKADQPQ